MHRLKEERYDAVEKVNECKAFNKTLEKKVADKELTASASLKEIRLLQMVLAKANSENELLTRSIEELLAKTSVMVKSTRSTTDELTKSVDSENIVVLMDLAWKISGLSSTEESELKIRYEHPQREWRGKRTETAEHYGASTITGG